MNYRITKFEKKNGTPQIPMSPAMVINSIIKATEGLYVHGGYIDTREPIENLWQDYEHGEGYTGYGVVWMKLRFKGKQPNTPLYVTIIVWDRGSEFVPLATHDGKTDIIDEEKLCYNQARAIPVMMDKITQIPLPIPPITYELLPNG